MARSSAYWAANPYRNADREPEPSAPYRDLPPAEAQRFRAARTGLRGVPGVSEQVRFMGMPWGWAWEYAIGSRKLCWLHPIPAGASATFTLTEDEEAKVLAIARLAEPIRQAVREAQRTGPVKWCTVPLPGRRHVDAFLGLARRKASWVGGRPSARRSAAS
ncbi:MAG TPA: DUF3788 family protein [Gemmatimonadales bacterium]|nr:DUF3788 family protein [Gemmatimonadales bacterium]